MVLHKVGFSVLGLKYMLRFLDTEYNFSLVLSLNVSYVNFFHKLKKIESLLLRNEDVVALSCNPRTLKVRFKENKLYCKA